MPQFEQIDTFVGQAFWLVVFFALFYLFLWRVISPRLHDAVNGRASRVASDLARAEEQHKESKECVVRRETRLKEARDEARANVDQHQREIQEHIEKRIEATMTMTEGAVRETEEAVAQAAREARAEIAKRLPDLVGRGIERLTDKAVSKQELDLLN